MWGKRAAKWNELSGMWGKRGWNDMSGGWGERRRSGLSYPWLTSLTCVERQTQFAALEQTAGNVGQTKRFRRRTQPLVERRIRRTQSNEKIIWFGFGFTRIHVNCDQSSNCNHSEVIQLKLMSNQTIIILKLFPNSVWIQSVIDLSHMSEHSKTPPKFAIKLIINILINKYWILCFDCNFGHFYDLYYTTIISNTIHILIVYMFCIHSRVSLNII